MEPAHAELGGASAEVAAAQPLTHGRAVVVFSGLLLAMLLAALDQTIVATALPTIVGELGGLERLAWVVTAYLLAQTVVSERRTTRPPSFARVASSMVATTAGA
jgi:MFS family permease